MARAEGLYGFRVIDRQVDFEAASPRACFDFSEPLAGAGTDYADFVRIDAGTFPVEARDRQLCIDGLAHGSRYQVTLRAGLPSAAGERLRASVGQEVYVRDRTPAVRFAGRAYVLPKSAEAAVPIVSVNATEAALRLYRVGTRNVATVIGNGDFGSPLTGERGNPPARHPGRAGLGGHRRARAGVQPRRDDDPAHGRRGRRAGARALRADRTRRRRAVRRGLGGLGDAVVRGDRSRARDA